MNDNTHTILCVDDEANIINSLRRLLRNDGYGILTATSGAEGLELLKENDVQVVISDQRMPEMSGIEFLSAVKEQYPDIIRIILTGYTEVDSITEAINKGQIYKFFLKPWNDQNLKLEIKQALEQYDLIQINRELHETILIQNEELKATNDNLENLVQQRTEALEIQNQALELSRTVLEDLPIPIIGVSSEGDIALINKQTSVLSDGSRNIEIGNEISQYFGETVSDTISEVLQSKSGQTIERYSISEKTYDVSIVPLSDRYSGKGVVMAFLPN